MPLTFTFTLERIAKQQCQPGRKQSRFMDAKVQGLGVRVTPSGTKTYIYYRRLPDQNESPRKLVETSLGKVGDLKLEQARILANELNMLVGQGKDPLLVRTTKVLTYNDIFKTYVEEYAQLHTVTWKEMKANHLRYFGRFRTRRVETINRDDVQKWLNWLANEKGRHTANRNFNTFRAVMQWAINRELFAGPNPCLGIRTFRTQARQRFLQPGDEYLRFAEALNAEPNETIRDFFWICLFTGARCSNVRCMEWSQINFGLMHWTIPLTKNGESQTIPLTTNATEILRRRYDSTDRNDRWVFCSERLGWRTRERGPLVGVRNAFSRIIERAEIEDLRIHDLRRTAGSYMAIQNVSPTIIGKALGHRSIQSTAIYARLTQDPVREALENAQAALTRPEQLRPKARSVAKSRERAHRD